MSNERIDINKYYLAIAKATSLRSDCERAKVGCILVKDKIIIGTGYNGSLEGHPHCDSGKTCLFEGRCIRTNHAEINAIERAIRAGFDVKGSIAYSSHSPCYSCLKTMAVFGIRIIFYETRYDDDKAFAYADLANITLIQVDLPKDLY